MQIKKVLTIYFSPTGNTKKVLRAMTFHVADQWGIPFEFYDITLPAGRNTNINVPEDTLVFFGLPVYAGRIPNKILATVQELFHGTNSPMIAVVTYGNRSYADALAELCGISRENGFAVCGAAAVPARHAFTDELAGGRPDVMDIQKIKQFTDRSLEQIRQADGFNSSNTYIEIPGNWPPGPYYVPLDINGNPAKFLKAVPKTKMDLCIKCGVCASVCPMGSVQMDQVVHNTGICIKCQACIRQCPSAARYMDDPAFLSHVEMLKKNYQKRQDPAFFEMEGFK